MVSERLAAPADRDARRLHAGHVHVSCDGVARLVDRDRPGLGGDVLDVLRGPGLDGRHRLDEVLQANRSRPEWCAYVSAIEQTCSIIAGE